VEIARVDELVTCGISTPQQFGFVNNAGKRWLEQTVNRDPERPDDFIEDVERDVCGTAFDVGDGLSSDAGSFGERGLRESGSCSGDDEVATKYLPRRRSSDWLNGGHRSTPDE
jgi:hypothetical protein